MIEFSQLLKFGYYLIGFLVYHLFCLLTFEIYSKKKEMTKVFILIFIYIYYSILAIYLISILNIKTPVIEIIVYSIIYLGLCAFFLKNYYLKYIKKEDDNLYG